MLYRQNPRTGEQLSALGFGCMRFPLGAEKTEKLIVSAVERGVNYFDTAFVYGNSEVTLGGILEKNGLREKINLATKLPYQQCRKYEDFDRIFSQQKERLKTGYFDYYLIHNLSDMPAWDKLRSLGIERWIDGKKETGEIRKIGFSFHGTRAAFAELLDAYDWEFCQIQYNYLNVNYQAGVDGLRKAHGKGIPVIVMEPLLGGKLAAGLPPKAERLFRDANPASSPAAWALRWLWSQPEVTVVLSGMNAPEQLDDNLKAADAPPLSEAERKVFPEVTKVFEESYKTPCTGCNYCMPCPHNVNIPGCFAAYNASYATGFVTGITAYLTSTGANHPEKSSRVVNCKKCGACEKKCPQHIPIMKSLDDVKRRMEPWWFNPALKIVQMSMGVKKET